MNPSRAADPRSAPAPHLALCGMLMLVSSGCWMDVLSLYLQQQFNTRLDVSFVRPLTTQNASAGAAAQIQWVDVATQFGTVIDLRVDRVDPATRAVISQIVLLTRQDALADGDADLFNWDVTGVVVGSYQPVIRLSAPDGRSIEKRATGDFNVQSALPVPLLAFSTPGGADVTVAAGGTLTIQWSDNGTMNPETRITLGLDLNSNHLEGNEILIVNNLPASDGGDSGSFVFSRVDANGAAGPPNTYFLFARLEDRAHDDGTGLPIIVNATGRVIVAP
jgi:hypothetical protein